MTTIQDAGRAGYAHIGVPKSGYMDNESAVVANQMLDNRDDEALLEVDVAGIILTVHVDCTVAVAGAKAQLLVNQKKCNTAQTIDLTVGDILEIKPLSAGMWTYVAFAGGLAGDEILGSCSTLLLAQLGGHHGRRLQTGNCLRMNHPQTVKGHPKPLFKRPPNNSIHSLPARAGPEFDLFTSAACENVFKKPFKMTEHISRQGMKITGPELLTHCQANIPSSGLVPGSLQVTPGGEYILTHRDSQTTGGYPRIIVLKQSALNQLAQIRPGESIYFYAD